MRIIKIFSLTLVLSLVLTACGTAKSVSEETGTTTDTETVNTKDAVSVGEGNLPVTVDDIMLVKNTDGNSIIDPLEDESTDTLDGAPISVSYNISDIDGDGVLKEEENYTVSVNVKNNSGEDMTLDNFKVYLQGAEDESITLDSIETDSDIDTAKLILDDDSVKYEGTDYNDMLVLKDGESITVNTTQYASSTYGGEVTAFKFTALFYVGEDTYSIDNEVSVEAVDE